MSSSPTLEDGSSPVATALDPRGRSLGRYVLLDRIGAGGMGVVYAAYDPHLDRKVALKLLHRGADETRLLREGQALARLSHPNVVAVHDVGMLPDEDARRLGLPGGEHVFVAMEYVDGTTLGGWLEAQTRTWPEILETLRRAGRGLAAAHAAELVHRDFKPDNVMVDHGGRVRVMDFGLARSQSVALPSEPTAPLPIVEAALATSGEVLSSPLTATGAILGTPAYMAPEQHRGGRADARSDQFAFCVTAWEALYGVRPFTGTTVAAIVLAISQGKLADPPAGSPVPAALRRVLARGLCLEPEARWPSMTALLEQLQVAPRRWRAPVGMAALSAGALALALGRSGVARPPDKCDGVGDAIAQTWNTTRRDALATAFGSVGRPYADDAWSRIAPKLDGYADAWSKMRRDTCEATHMAGTQSEQLLDLRMACLDRARDQLDALLSELSRHDPGVARRATSVVANLPRLASCADAQRLAATLPLPDDPAARDAVLAVRGELDAVAAVLWAGRFEAARAPVTEAVDHARATGFSPVIAEALLLKGRTLSAVRDDEAEATLHEAIVEAARGHHDEVATTAWARLVHVAADANELPKALAWAHAAEAAAIRAGDDPLDRVNVEVARGEAMLRLDDLEGAASAFARARVFFSRSGEPGTHQYARMLTIDGVVKSQHNDIEGAIASLLEAETIYVRVAGPSHPNVADVVNNLAIQYARLDRTAEAEAQFDRVLDIVGSAYGADSPELLPALLGKASLLTGLHRDEEARAAAERALAIAEAGLGPEHPEVAIVLERLGEQLSIRDPEAAIEHLRRALDIRIATTGEEDHVSTTWARQDLGSAYLNLGDTARGIAELDTVVALVREAHGPDAEHLGKPYYLLAKGHRMRGELDEARRWARESEALYTRVYGPTHRDVTFAIQELARVELDAGDLAEATAQLERVVAIQTEVSAPAVERGRVLLELARVRARARDDAGARARAAEARAVLEAADDREALAELAAFEAALPRRG